jgi:cytidylate kinase
MEEATKDVTERDKRDSSRDLAPLRVADDAIYIDSSDMELEEVMKTVLDAVGSQKAKA